VGVAHAEAAHEGPRDAGPSSMPSTEELADNLLLPHALCPCHGPHNSTNRANPQRFVVGHRQPVPIRRLGLKDDVAAFAVYDPVAE